MRWQSQVMTAPRLWPPDVVIVGFQEARMDGACFIRLVRAPVGMLPVYVDTAQHGAAVDGIPAESMIGTLESHHSITTTTTTTVATPCLPVACLPPSPANRAGARTLPAAWWRELSVPQRRRAHRGRRLQPSAAATRWPSPPPHQHPLPPPRPAHGHPILPLSALGLALIVQGA